MPTPAINLTDHELEVQSTDTANYPYIKLRGGLYWDGSAWQKWTGALAAGTAAIGSVNIRNTDGADNSYTSGGVYGQKVHVVGISNLHVEGDVSVGSSLTGVQPVAIGFKDGSGNNQFVLGDTTNGLWTSVKAIAAGSNLIGKVGIDQATDGTTNKVYVGNTVTVGSHAVTNAGTFAVQGTIPSGATRVQKTVTATTAQTGTAIITPTSGKTLTIKYVQIQVGGTTAGTVQVWFGGSGDTTYSRGTDPAIFDGEFAPSSTLKPGFVTPSVAEGWTSGTANDVLRYTTSAAMTITITAWGYEA